MMDLNSDTGSFITETVAPDEPGAQSFVETQGRETIVLEDKEEARTLGLWLSALQSFFQLRNHPLSEAEQAEAATRDWANELRIARRCLLQTTQLALQLGKLERAGESEEPANVTGDLSLSDSIMPAPAAVENDSEFRLSTSALADVLTNACVKCEALMEARSVSHRAWVSLGRNLSAELERCNLAKRLMRAAGHHAGSSLQAPLLKTARTKNGPPSQGADLLHIFASLSRMLQSLRFIERVLRRDQPLKTLLPLFTLLHEEARSLVDFIETRAMRVDGLDEALFDTLDGTNYAISMELRKVFAHELVGLSALRQPTAIYARVENAYGLLRDCFQQSTVALAQLFDPSIEGAQLFDTFQTKLQQSLSLRRDLWTLLQLVRRAERERDQRPVAPLLERLSEFREGSLRYLMYKDWEACERFMEEVGAARGAVELTPVLHRFGAYLETLHGQVNMRAVLANHPFDYPEMEA